MKVCATCAIPVLTKGTSRTTLTVCSVCRSIQCGRHVFYYADESNAAVTKSARPKCGECWEARK